MWASNTIDPDYFPEFDDDDLLEFDDIPTIYKDTMGVNYFLEFDDIPTIYNDT